MVDVGVDPSIIKNQAALIAALDAAFKSVKVDVDLTDLPARIAAAKPTRFVDVVTLRREVYDQIRRPDPRPGRHRVPRGHPAAGADPRPSPGRCSAPSAR